jgi:hypothetical protein
MYNAKDITSGGAQARTAVLHTSLSMFYTAYSKSLFIDSKRNSLGSTVKSKLTTTQFNLIEKSLWQFL